MAANDAVSMNVAENRQNVPMAIQENRAAVPMTVAEGGGTPGGLNRKADKVTGAVAGNLAGLDANGNLTDSGKAPGDFLEAPATAGSEGQVLTADGEGGASWQDPTGGDPTEIIDDNAGSGDTDKVWSADKSHELLTEINSSKDRIQDIGEAILSVLQHVAFKDDDGADAYDDLHDLIIGVDPLASISATFDGCVLYESDTLAFLKSHLTVTATYTDSRGTVTLTSDQYELSGSLVGGTPTITVLFSTKTTTISPNVYGLAFTKKYTNAQNSNANNTIYLNGNNYRIAGNAVEGSIVIKDGNGNSMGVYVIPIRSGLEKIVVAFGSCETSYQIWKWSETYNNYIRQTSSGWSVNPTIDITSYNNGDYFITFNSRTSPEGSVTDVDTDGWTATFS